MTFLKRWLSAFLGVFLVLSLCPISPAFAVNGAESNHDSAAEQKVVNDNSDAGNADKDKSCDASEEADSPELDGESLHPQNGGDVTSLKLNEDIASVIEFIYVDLKVTAQGDKQSIAVSLMDSSKEIADMSLTVSDETGVVRDFNASSKVGNAALFSISIDDKYKPGLYKISELSYRLKNDNQEHIVTVPNDEDGGYAFTVLPDGALNNLSGKTIDKSVEDTTAFTIDEKGSLTEMDSVGAAVAKLRSSSKSLLSSNLQSSNLVVALDPGHGTDPDSGRYDPGASANGIVEATLNESITRYCKEELEQYLGVTVLVTPRYSSVDRRVDWSVSNGAQIYVSIHNNSGSPSARGFEIYIPNDSKYNYYTHEIGNDLAQKIAEQLRKLGLSDRGIRTRDSEYYNGSGPFYYEDKHLADFYSAIAHSREKGIAGIIVEHAFVTNPDDAAFLQDENNLKKLGVGDATAIAQQYGLLKVSEEAYKGVYDFDYYITHNPDVFSAFGNDHTAVFRHFYEYGMNEGRRASEVFDPSFYKANNADLRSAFGSEMSSYYMHFIDFGMSEGRQGSDSFSVQSYYNQYPDLRRAFGTSLKPYYIHYIEYGQKEGRAATGCQELLGYTTSRDGVDYSALYDGAYYCERNPDLKEWATRTGSVIDDAALLSHFINFGMSEGRQGSDSFSVQSYYNQYPDLRRAFGSDLKSYYLHYIEHGKAEGRAGTGCDELVGYVSSRNGVDYGAVYDGSYYCSQNSDLKEWAARTGSIIDDDALLSHFINFGMSEGRQGSDSFSVQSYYNQYPDLRRAFGSDLKSYYLHYIEHGKAEGRAGTGCDELVGYVSSRNGVDYGAVYDGSYYCSQNSDLKEWAARTGSVIDDAALLSHFINFGMSEGRQGSDSFSVQSYYNQYPDLRRAFGSDLKSYYLHYIEHGKAEGRAGTGCDELVGYVSSRNGVDYGAVYDGSYYCSQNSDLKEWAARTGSIIDDDALLSHFINFGMSEGRQGSDSFSVQSYYNQYPDLRRAFGSDLKSYYLHYIEHGKAEGRAGTGCDELIPDDTSSIMGDSQASVLKMVSYFNSKNKEYPSNVYAAKGAPNIEMFSQLVYQEASAEGVRAEVLFCQAMKETGWLQFGGSVRAEQCNFGGLGATSPTAGGATFENVKIGLRAQVQHLKLYASTDNLVHDCVDPRWDSAVQQYGRGCAPSLEQLDGRWAVPGIGYGERIYEMIQELMGI